MSTITSLNIMRANVVCVKVKDIRPKYHDLCEWMDDPNNVYIGRRGIVFITRNGEKYRWPKVDSPWCNPFSIKSCNGDRDLCINKYREYIRNRISIGDITREDILALRGKTLGCWCKEGGVNIPCHGDVILELLR